MIVPVMAILNLVLTQQIYSEETNGAHAHNRDRVPLNPCASFEGDTTIFYVLWGAFRWAVCLQRDIPTGVHLLPDYHQGWSLIRDLTVHILVSLQNIVN